jgi:FO synthase subunit 1
MTKLGATVVFCLRCTGRTNFHFATMSRIITYSPAYTLVPTYECFNRCTYCNFRANPGESPWLTLPEAASRLLPLWHQGAIEVLILSGEVHPESRRRSLWFRRIYDLCQLTLSLGFLPHTNAGPLSFEEMTELKEVNASMGLMLEQMTPRLLETVHQRAPSKNPQGRRQQLEWAGELQIPFTTGLLLGIGETVADWRETLAVIAEVQERWGHIQEVIIQPYSSGSCQIWEGESFDLELLPEAVVMAREMLPLSITLQIPPNLAARPEVLLACLEAGARDLGGIGPRDEVNPDYPHLLHGVLTELLASAGWELLPRLPVYPQYDAWLSPGLGELVREWRGKIKPELVEKPGNSKKPGF